MPLKESKIKKVCKTFFEGDLKSMHAYATQRLIKGHRAVDDLGHQFRDIIKSRNRTEFWLQVVAEIENSDPSIAVDHKNPWCFKSEGNGVVLANAFQDIRSLFGSDDIQLVVFLISRSFFVHPLKVTSSSVFPSVVRESNAHYKGIQRGAKATYKGKTVEVKDNGKVQLAFKKAIQPCKVELNGYSLAHIWERVFDPAFCTAAWNMCYLPSFLKNFTENQHPVCVMLSGVPVLLSDVIKQVAYNLYFVENDLNQGKVIRLHDEVSQHVVDPEINLTTLGVAPKVV